jgi:uncharacterized protein YndB with AHSA1/START domain
MSRTIVMATEIQREPKLVYETISTREGLATFWTPDVQGDDAEGGELTFGFAQAPARLPMHVTRLDEPSEITWHCTGDWPFWGDTDVSWSITPGENGTQVLFRHTGFADEMPDVAFGSVSLTWGVVVARLKEVIEHDGAPNPALR